MLLLQHSKCASLQSYMHFQTAWLSVKTRIPKYAPKYISMYNIDPLVDATENIVHHFKIKQNIINV